jgi:hypothetical protein
MDDELVPYSVNLPKGFRDEMEAHAKALGYPPSIWVRTTLIQRLKEEKDGAIQKTA